MPSADQTIRFKAKLLQPLEAESDDPWLFLLVPKNASAQLPSRGMTAIAGTINGAAFKATLEPDGQKSHWLKVSQKLRKAAGAAVGDVVALEITPLIKQPETKLPPDVRNALAIAPEARALWSNLTAVARRDWIQWITSAKKPETRARRIENTVDMLLAGKRRVCCFDRSGVYSKGLSAPKAAD